MKSITGIVVVLFLLCTSELRQSQVSNVNGSDTLSFVSPANFPEPVYRFVNNPLTSSGVELGKKLFYDPILSKDYSIACSNCHQPFAAFANLDHDVSHGVDDCFGTRNAPALFNLVWQKEFMWDGGVKHIEFSPLNALTSDCEMANNLDTIVGRLKNNASYAVMFDKAFGPGEINSQRLLRALAQFTSILVSATSKYDKVMRHEPGFFFTPVEQKGYELFKAHCSSCHAEPLFTDGSYRSNGLDIFSADPGRDTITNLASDRGKFKVPSLRNVELSRPYMHDGRFYTLEEVLDHYASGVQANPNLDPQFKKGNRRGIELSQEEKQELLLFLKTLTDREFVKDKRFQ